jgi:hypothetical protein
MALDEVDEAGDESFPASDAPSWWSGSEHGNGAAVPPLPSAGGVAHNWGMSVDEVRAAYPCDPMVPAADEALYRAVSVNASPAQAFRWLCQLRAAPYSYDWVDNRGRTSPRKLTPGLEELAVGQTVMSIFELVGFRTDDHLTLRLQDPGGRRVFGDLAVSYCVRPGPKGGTRLLVKMMVRYPRSLLGRVMRRVLPWGDLVMMRKQLLTLKTLAERASALS